MATGITGIIGVDLDGTVLDEDKKVSEGVRCAIVKAIDLGFIVVPITGRPMIGLPEDLMAIPKMDYAISANSAEIYRIESYSERKYEKIYQRYLTGNAVLETLKIAEDFNAVPDVFIEGTGHIDLKNKQRIPELNYSPAVTEYILRTKSYDSDFSNVINANLDNIAKITVNFPRTEEGLKVKAECKKVLETISGVAVVSGAVQNLEVTDIEAQKGNGLLMLAEILGVPCDRTMAVGDDGNDMDMILKAGFGVAMGNAIPELKEAADFVTEDNGHDGVAVAIEKFIERICNG